MINHSVVYAMACLMYLARRRGQVIPLSEIAAGQGLPTPYCQKLLGALAKAGLISSSRGHGYSLSRDPKDVNLRQVMEALSSVTHPHAKKEQDGFTALTETIDRKLSVQMEGVHVSDFIENSELGKEVARP